MIFCTSKKYGIFAGTVKSNRPSQINTIFLATGSNLGNRKARLQQAEQLIQSHIGKIIAASSIYETAPWGHADQPDFFNQVLKVESTMSPSEVLSGILSIEEMMGRKRTFRYAPREIDIDILFFNDEVINEENIIIPHPFLHKRNFVLAPLLEIAPEMVHPIRKEKITQLAEHCDDLLRVKKLGID